MHSVEENYASGDDFVIEFMRYVYRFSARDFEERVTAAAVRLELIDTSDLDPAEADDLVELAWQGRIVAPRSRLGAYLVRHWELVGIVAGESLVYWLRKLVFRSAYIDHRVKAGLLDVNWDEQSGDFGYSDAQGGRSLLELAPTPSWAQHRFRGH